MKQPGFFTEAVRGLCENNREWMLAEGYMGKDCVLTPAGLEFWRKHVHCTPAEAVWIKKATGLSPRLTAVDKPD